VLLTPSLFAVLVRRAWLYYAGFEVRPRCI